MAKNRFWRIIGVLGLLCVLLAGALPTAVSAAYKPINYSPTDVGPKIRQWEATTERIDGEPAGSAVTGGSASMAPSNAVVGEVKTFMRLDDYNGSYGFASYTLRAQGTKAEVWVQNNLNWPAGDPRTAPVITSAQALYMLGQFENTILPKETSYFGSPDMHDGTYSLLEEWGYFAPGYFYDETGHIIILVSNVRDENYYDSTYPIYIAGFYSPSYEAYFDRNIITIDAYDWLNRTGPSGTRPYLYEGVVAHEWQHLLHSDYDPSEETFINEGMAEYAEIVCGYTPSLLGHINAAAANPENSLTSWGDQGDLEILTDYGQAALFQIYLNEQFGKVFTQALFHNTATGISGVNATLAQLKIRTDFASIFHDWSVAMLINSSKAGGKYAIKTFPTFALNVGTAAIPNPQAFDTPGAPPWGNDFIWINGNPKDLARFTFNGVEYSTFPSAWTSVGGALWSGAGDLVDNWAIFPTAGGGTLSFDTKYDIEEAWDFGFVQVSTDNGLTWTSLANASTTSIHDPSALPKAVANLPGLTGTQAAWVNMSFDLSAYTGQNILVAFRYVTDWATSYDGWVIDNVKVDDTLISDGTSMAPFSDITQIVPIKNNFTVTFIGYKGTGIGTQYKVAGMNLSNVTQTGLFELNKVLSWADKAVMLVSYDAGEGISFYADYTYGFTYKNSGPKK